MVGTKIRTIREIKKITQGFMANKLGISQTAYSKIESNQTHLTIDRLKEIAEILNVSEHELINELTLNPFDIDRLERKFSHIHSFMENQKAVYEKLIGEKDLQIQQLKELISQIRG